MNRKQYKAYFTGILNKSLQDLLYNWNTWVYPEEDEILNLELALDKEKVYITFFDEVTDKTYQTEALRDTLVSTVEDAMWRAYDKVYT